MKVNLAQLCLTLQPNGLNSPWNSPGQNTGVGSLFFLQGVSLEVQLVKNWPAMQETWV